MVDGTGLVMEGAVGGVCGKETNHSMYSVKVHAQTLFRFVYIIIIIIVCMPSESQL